MGDRRQLIFCPLDRSGAQRVISITRPNFQNTTGGKAVEIVVSLLNSHVELTAVHEVGHFLDFKALDRSTFWASASSPALAPWREAIKRSRPSASRQPRLSDIRAGFLFPSPKPSSNQDKRELGECGSHSITLSRGGKE